MKLIFRRREIWQIVESVRMIYSVGIGILSHSNNVFFMECTFSWNYEIFVSSGRLVCVNVGNFTCRRREMGLRHRGWRMQEWGLPPGMAIVKITIWSQMPLFNLNLSLLLIQLLIIATTLASPWIYLESLARWGR